MFCGVVPVTWHKTSSCRACWQLQEGEAYRVVRKMGQMGEEDRFTTQGDVAIEPEPDRQSQMTA